MVRPHFYSHTHTQSCKCRCIQCVSRLTSCCAWLLCSLWGPLRLPDLFPPLLIGWGWWEPPPFSDCSASREKKKKIPTFECFFCLPQTYDCNLFPDMQMSHLSHLFLRTSNLLHIKMYSNLKPECKTKVKVNLQCCQLSKYSIQLNYWLYQGTSGTFLFRWPIQHF